MTKQIQSILLIFVFSMPFQAKLAVIAHFIINQEFIAQEICVNKNKKGLDCHGKCQLQKELNQVDQETDSQHQTLPQLKLQNLEYCTNATIGIQKSIGCIISGSNTEISTIYYHNAIASIFHPPKKLATFTIS